MLTLDLVAFSHLRWDFVYQRPQHLMTRFAFSQRVFYIQETVNTDQPDHYEKYFSQSVCIITPFLYSGNKENIAERQCKIIDEIFSENDISSFIAWYYTPMALIISTHLKPALIIYDCMDELSAFKFAPPQLKELENDLFKKADIVFTGGYSLFYAKEKQHSNIYPFPSSIDKKHFEKARLLNSDNDFYKNIPHPRLGFYGVLDERFDINLIRDAAKQKPDWHFILIGPVVKINPDDLPHAENIHYAGTVGYEQLPDYISSWDGALIPFALNDSTKYISPTKTPEYLAAGKPVLSTAIADVANPYGKENLVYIINSAEDLIAKFTLELNKTEEEKMQWLFYVDEFLKDNSWDNTWRKMVEHITRALYNKRHFNTLKSSKEYV